MKIAIIDDNEKARNQMLSFIEEFGKEHECEFLVSAFCDGEELLNCNPHDYDILFLDIDMPGRNGIEIARKLRESNDRVAILFVTALAQYAIDAFSVDALDYLLKPIQYSDFKLKFQKTLKHVGLLRPAEVLLETQGVTMKVAVDDIVYVEVYGHYLFYHLTTDDAPIRVRDKIADCCRSLSAYGFLRCHKSYLINPIHIEKLTSASVKMKNGDEVPIGRTYKDATLKALLSYYRK